MAPTLSFDFSRTPSASQRSALSKRLARLRLLESSMLKAVTAFESAADATAARPEPLLIRDEFVYLTTPVQGDGSDRRVPPREFRPPATKISSSRGAALRLELTALALAQLRHRTGSNVKNALPLEPNVPDAQPTGWIDLIASPVDL